MRSIRDTETWPAGKREGFLIAWPGDIVMAREGERLLLREEAQEVWAQQP
jgi:hypothetical protein